nr:MAG TPA: hypothetical protein [Caudoviricetes sp.]
MKYFPWLKIAFSLKSEGTNYIYFYVFIIP